MKHILPAILLIGLLSGCEVLHRPGIIVRDPVQKVGKNGTYEKMEDSIVINGDVPGLSEVPTRHGPIRIATVGGRKVITTTDPKTGIVTTSEEQTPGGLYVSGMIAARGAADKSRGDSFWSGVSGTLLSYGLAAFGAGVAPGAGSALNTVAKGAFPTP